MRYNAKMTMIRKQMRQPGPMLKGSLVDRKIPCGKPSCRCKEGEGHPGLYLTYSLKGKTKTVYVPKKMSAKAREWAQNYAQFRELLEAMFQIQIKTIKEGK